MKTKQILLTLIFVGLAFIICTAQHASKVLETDSHYLANIRGLYLLGPNGEHIWNTNVARFWQGLWKEGTNHWRVQLFFSQTNTPDVTVIVGIGSIINDSGDGTNVYYTAPHGRFAKFVLLSPDGTVVRPTGNMALEEDFPNQISSQSSLTFLDGRIRIHMNSFTNAPPHVVGSYRLNEMYSITNNGEYTLIVCPVLYKYETNGDLYQRIDLPLVSAKVNLMPSP